MPSHFCIDPHDQYAQAEVLVKFTIEADKITLNSVFDLSGLNILSDLDNIQRQIIEREIAIDYKKRPIINDVRLHRVPSWANNEEKGYGSAE